MNKNILSLKELSMKKKLFMYMLLLGIILLICLIAGMYMLGQLNSADSETTNSLQLQMSNYEKDISNHFGQISAAGINLSEDMAFLMDKFLDENDMHFPELNDNEDSIKALQEKMIEPLRQNLLQENCSGIFVMWDITVNSALSVNDLSKSGIYLQINGYDISESAVLLYRGLAETGKKHNIMPHRKWHLEFDTQMYEEFSKMKTSSVPYDESYTFSSIDRIPGTSERAIHLIVPITGRDGTFYGICGFEISESYFMTYHAQPTAIQHLSCMLTEKYDSGMIDSAHTFSCGVLNGYYREPAGTLCPVKTGKVIHQYKGDSVDYVGISKEISLSPNNNPYLLSVMILKSDYDNIKTDRFLKSVILVILLLFFAVNCSMFFSRKFLSPILKALEDITSDNTSTFDTTLPEINDLFEFLAKKDTLHEKNIEELKEKMESYKSEIARLEKEYEHSRAEISRLAYSRKQEVDPDNYKLFLEGINILTPTERKIFDYYLSGKSVKEIIEIAGIKESTIRFHNQNIYSKLGVNSLKQLLRYAALMENDKK